MLIVRKSVALPEPKFSAAIAFFAKSNVKLAAAGVYLKVLYFRDEVMEESW